MANYAEAPDIDELSIEDIQQIEKQFSKLPPINELHPSVLDQRRKAAAQLMQKTGKINTNVSTDYVNHIAQLVEKIETKKLTRWEKFVAKVKSIFQ